MREAHNNHRAAHYVNVMPFGTNVRFKHKGYIISLAADGQETQIWKEKDDIVIWETPGTSATSVVKAVAVIDALTKEN